VKIVLTRSVSPMLTVWMNTHFYGSDEIMIDVCLRQALGLYRTASYSFSFTGSGCISCFYNLTRNLARALLRATKICILQYLEHPAEK
jgi:hypothetical protein